MSDKIRKAFIVVYGEPYGELLWQDLGRPATIQAVEQAPVTFGRNTIRGHDIYQLILGVRNAYDVIDVIGTDIKLEPVLEPVVEASESSKKTTGRRKSKAAPQQTVEDSEAEEVKEEPEAEAEAETEVEAKVEAEGE